MRQLNHGGMRLMIVVIAFMIFISGGVAWADFAFGEPVNLGSPINSSSHEFTVAISTDNLEMYISSDRPGGAGYFDIYRRTRQNEDDPWGPLVNVETINGPYNDSYPFLAADGLTLYFSDWYNWNTNSNRPGGRGDHDLWMSTRASTVDSWGPPVNMGAVVNSAYADVSPCVSLDGQTLIFSSKRPGGFGDYDLWMSTRPTADSDWAEPVNMGPGLNSSAYDGEPWLSPDGLTLFFSSECPPGRTNSSDIWVTTRRSRDAAWSPPVNLGSPINTSNPDGSPSFSPDLKTFYFNSDRSGGFGGWDMYEVPIVPILDFNGDGIVDIDDLLILIENWGCEESLCDIAPMPWGDSVVNEKDLKVLMSSWGQDVDDPTLIAHWKLDENEGIIAADSAGDVQADLYGNPQWRPADGMVDGALMLDGIDDFVGTWNIPGLSAGKFSVFAWIKGGAPGQVAVSQFRGVNWLLADASEGYLRTDLGDQPLVSDVTITDGDWHHVGITWDGTNRVLYVNDAEAASDTQASLNRSEMGLNIGCNPDSTSGTFFSGLIDDVRIYNRAIVP